MADEWERELIHSAKKLHIGMAQQQATGKGKGKGRESDDEDEIEVLGSSPGKAIKSTGRS